MLRQKEQRKSVTLRPGAQAESGLKKADLIYLGDAASETKPF